MTSVYLYHYECVAVLNKFIHYFNSRGEYIGDYFISMLDYLAGIILKCNPNQTFIYTLTVLIKIVQYLIETLRESGFGK